MTDKLKQVSKREIEKLPTEIQEAIRTVDWSNISEVIGKKYLQDESEVNDFQAQVLLMLIGLADPELFAQNVENEVGTSKEEAENISKETFEKIFNPISEKGTSSIRDNMKNINPNWEQSLNFILSGGNYAALLEQGHDIIE